MGTSDFLMVISILVALVTVTIANNKKIWLYKFTYRSLYVGLVCVVLVNYLIFYDYLCNIRKWPAFLAHENGLPAEYWAYLISVLGLVVLIFYVAKCKLFPKKNWDKIVNYYHELMTENPSLLIGFIEKYHLSNFERSIKRFNQESNMDPSPYEEDMKKKFCHRKIFTDGLSSKVWSDIILTEEFVFQCVRIHSLFPLRIFSLYQGDNIPNGKELIQLYFKELIKKKNPIFMQELEEFFQHEKEPVIDQAVHRIYFKYIFQKDFPWLAKYEVVRAVGKEAEKEIATEWPSFKKKTNEWDNEKYHQTVSYQCMRMYALQYMYLSEFIKKHPDEEHKKPCREKLPYANTLADICKAIYRQTSNIENGTYADKFIDDCRTVIYEVLCFMSKGNSIDYVSSLVQCNLGITKYINNDYPPHYPKDATSIVMEQYIHLCVNGLNDKVKEEYLKYLSKIEMNLKYWNEALAELRETYEEEPAFNQLKELFQKKAENSPKISR
ncbi:MAG: hypothetical protein IKQ75_10270 [Bacteroidales bacterium]|nr:hypothetical protein [Bacteroidales bacterium]